MQPSSTEVRTSPARVLSHWSAALQISRSRTLLHKFVRQRNVQGPVYTGYLWMLCLNMRLKPSNTSLICTNLQNKDLDRNKHTRLHSAHFISTSLKKKTRYGCKTTTKSRDWLVRYFWMESAFQTLFFFSPRCYFTIRGGGEGSCLKIPPCKWSLGSQPSWSGPLGSRVFFWIFIHELNRASPANRKNFQHRIKESFYSSSGWIKKTSWTNTTQESRTLISSSKNTPVPF